MHKLSLMKISSARSLISFKVTLLIFDTISSTAVILFESIFWVPKKLEIDLLFSNLNKSLPTDRFFAEFNSSLKETCDFIIENKGEEVISEKHDKDFESKKENKEVPKPKSEEPENVKEEESVEESVEEEKDFADVDFEDDAE